MVWEITNCNDCEHLNITEEDQDLYYKINELAPPNHFCLKYSKKLRHSYAHGPILPCSLCEKDDTE